MEKIVIIILIKIFIFDKFSIINIMYNNPLIYILINNIK